MNRGAILLLLAVCSVLLVSGARVPAVDEEFNAVPEVGTDKICYVPRPTVYQDKRYHFEVMRYKYSGCTHVMGDLVISFLVSPHIKYDLSFLENIRYVSGYVGIYANSYPEVVPLPRLEIIRGNTSFRHHFKGLHDITLVIGANSHKQIYMPRLKEISKGSVLISLESAVNLCYLDTIDWSPIVREGTVHIFRNNATCPPCSQACDLSDKWRGHCWGPTDDLCQIPTGRTDCAESCSKRCSILDGTVCCHPQCAIACSGPSPRQCLACKDYRMPDGTCVSHCTDESRTNAYGQQCIPRDLRLD